MRQPIANLLRLNDAGRTNPIAFIARAIARWRRGYPSPEDFARMGPKKTRAYLRKIGFEQQSTDALARHRAAKAEAVDD